MNNIKTGGLVNPVFIVAGNANPRELAQQLESMQTGLTLRDYFAGQALIALRNHSNTEYLAKRAYEIADAMLRARQQPTATE